MFYKDYHMHESLFDCCLKSSGTIQVKVTNKHDGWTVRTSDYQVIQGSRYIWTMILEDIQLLKH